MKLYHGTTLDRYRCILRDGELKTTTKELSPYPKEGYSATQCGYLYLTSKESLALDFAGRAFLAENGHLGPIDLVVLELELDENEVEVDADEEKFDFNNVNCCYRIKRNISKFALKSKMYCFKIYEEFCIFLDSKI